LVRHYALWWLWRIRLTTRKSHHDHYAARLQLNDAAALTFGYLTALNFLRKANVTSGQSVDRRGFSSVGTAAVELAVHFGARVTGVSSAANLDLVRKLGAEQTLDYNSSEYANDKTLYDVLVDTVGKTHWKKHLAV
jgi:NADPH:quinone reductase-like Zn-dependent oxidoreductase